MRVSLPIPSPLESFRLFVEFQLEVLEDSIRYSSWLLDKIDEKSPISVDHLINNGF